MGSRSPDLSRPFYCRVSEFLHDYGARQSVRSREYDPADGHGLTDEIWQAPSYGILDLHAYYDLPLELGSAKPQLFLHVFNALDEVYIQDAVHVSSYNSWDKAAPFADDAEVFFGLPTSFNLGLSVNF